VRAIKYRELKRMYDLSGPEKTVRHLQEALDAGDLKPKDFSIRELAEVTLSPERVRQRDPRQGGACLLDAVDSVDVSAFSSITGQVVQAQILEAYTQEAFVLSRLVETIPTRLDGERIPGIGRISDEVAEVRPGMPYPSINNGEDQGLAERFCRLGVAESDPVALGFPPFLVYCWAGGLHFSWAGSQGYAKWGRLLIEPATVAPGEPPVRLEESNILPGIHERMF